MDEEIDEIGYEGVAEGYDSVSEAWDAAASGGDSGVLIACLPERGGRPDATGIVVTVRLLPGSRWVAQDKAGIWREYSRKPVIGQDGWDIADMDNDFYMLWNTRKENVYWKDSLMWVWGETKEE